MARRGNIPKREVLPDPLYQSTLATKFINNLMMDGKKAVSERIFYGAMKIIEERTSDDPIKIFR
ncbi:MAG: 30S ribosomal protein S7, partial [Planctomycetota bacterium]|nr:30S ribosomal protein S7 [Planctomycetota bacterium]